MELWYKFKDSYVGLIIHMVLFTIMGFIMVIYPEKIDNWFIVVLGFAWILAGVNYGLDIVIKKLKSKL